MKSVISLLFIIILSGCAGGQLKIFSPKIVVTEKVLKEKLASKGIAEAGTVVYTAIEQDVTNREVYILTRDLFRPKVKGFIMYDPGENLKLKIGDVFQVYGYLKDGTILLEIPKIPSSMAIYCLDKSEKVAEQKKVNGEPVLDNAGNRYFKLYSAICKRDYLVDVFPKRGEPKAINETKIENIDDFKYSMPFKKEVVSTPSSIKYKREIVFLEGLGETYKFKETRREVTSGKLVYSNDIMLIKNEENNTYKLKGRKFTIKHLGKNRIKILWTSR